MRIIFGDAGDLVDLGPWRMQGIIERLMKDTGAETYREDAG
jgi:hypothetical protein